MSNLMPPKRQTFTSEYGRKGIVVSASCPTRALRRRLSQTHVGTSEADVAAMVHDAIAGQRADGNTGWTEAAESEAVRFALWQHAENLASYAWVMGGH